MGGHDQSQVKIKFKKFEKVKSVPKDIPKSHNNDKVNQLIPSTDLQFDLTVDWMSAIE